MAGLAALWHCARPALAKSYLDFLGAGVVTSTSIFAPRRTGKTIFLLKDLLPAAEAAGYRVAYADLWQTEVRPALSIIRGLEQCLEPRNLREQVIDKLTTPLKKAKIKGEFGGAKAEAEVEFSEEKAAAAEAGLRIEDLIAKLVAKGPLLLLLDEAQTLAKNAANEELAKSLRTALTKHRDRVRVLYTGSNRARLAHMFSDAEAPLYAPGMGVTDFPVLGRDLVEFAAVKFDAATGSTRTLNVDAALHVLIGMQHRPEPFLRAVQAMLLTPGVTLEAAAEAALKTSTQGDEYEGTWKSLTALQRDLLVRCLVDGFQPFSAATATELAVTLGIERLATSSVQRAMKSLDARNILSKSPRGPYEFDDHLFKRWIETHAVG